MSCALTSHAKWFQLFHPIGGVRARRLSSERAGWCATASPTPRQINREARTNTAPLLSRAILPSPLSGTEWGTRGGGPASEPEHGDTEREQRRAPHQVDRDAGGGQA